ncbi:MAG: formylmethanofuran dehydrogenase subunit E family protein [Methanocorpusculum sp.]|nr:formylmethanofuran dehydrogenase subunit E family protein [Methanocorpusculum sp.]
MTQVPTFQEIVSSHGHTCPGIALGYKIAVVAAEWSGDETNISVVSNTTRCPLDALRTTFDLKKHPERLTVNDINKSNFILTKPNGSKLIIEEVPGSKVKNAEGDALRQKMKDGKASVEEIARFDEIQKAMLQQMIDTPNEKLFTCRTE